MPRSRRLTSLAVILLFVVAGPALAQPGGAPNVTGEWALAMAEGPQEVVSLDIVFAQDEDSAITGTVEGSIGSYDVTGMIEGEMIMFYFVIGSPDEEGSSQWFFEGTVEEDKAISGTMNGNMDEFTVEFTAARKAG